MALVKCPSCEKSVSNEAKACPHCGHPLQEDAPVQFHRIAILLFVVLGLIWAGPAIYYQSPHPCGMLKNAVMQEQMSEMAMSGMDGLEALGFAAGSAAMDRMVGGLSPRQCVQGLVNHWREIVLTTR